MPSPTAETLPELLTVNTRVSPLTQVIVGLVTTTLSVSLATAANTRLSPTSSVSVSGVMTSDESGTSGMGTTVLV
jgi:hypothetical protein